MLVTLVPTVTQDQLEASGWNAERQHQEEPPGQAIALTGVLGAGAPVQLCH